MQQCQPRMRAGGIPLHSRIPSLLASVRPPVSWRSRLLVQSAQPDRPATSSGALEEDVVQKVRKPLELNGMAQDLQEDEAQAAVAQGNGIVQTGLVGGTSESEGEEMEVFETEAGIVEPISEDEAQVDFLGESTEGNLHLVDSLKKAGVINVFGMSKIDDIYALPIDRLKKATQAVLDVLSVSDSFPHGDPKRAIYCSRTLNLRSIKTIGYDMDYTLIHYDVNAWEGRAYAYGLETLREQGIPVDGLHFDSDLVIRGLIMDKELGNLIKVDRFGLVKRAMHGTRMLSWQEIREQYGREVVNLRNEGRWVFLNTLFSVSEAVMYMQLVDRLDLGLLSVHTSTMTYQMLYGLVAKALYRTHVEGKLKAEIIQAPEKYVELDPQMAQTLLDQKDSGKQLLLITNSDYEYTDKMMCYAYNRFLPNGMRWRDLFDMVIVNARKPDFFNYNMSLYEVVTEDGLMRPVLAAKKGGLFCGGSARMVEKALGVEGDDVLYVGDHIYTDAALAKINFRWRTALIIRELEQEVEALALGRPHRDRLKELMNKKELIGDVFNQLRLARQRFVAGHNNLESFDDEEGINETLGQLLMVMEALDEQIGPALEQDGRHFNSRWGYLSRAGLNDKSQLCRQIEKYADIYTSRVSNFLRYTPYQYFRSPSQSLAHDRNLSRYARGALDGTDRDSPELMHGDESDQDHGHHVATAAAAMTNPPNRVVRQPYRLP